MINKEETLSNIMSAAQITHDEDDNFKREWDIASNYYSAARSNLFKATLALHLVKKVTDDPNDHKPFADTYETTLRNYMESGMVFFNMETAHTEKILGTIG